MLVPGYCTLCRSRCGALHQIEDGRLTAVLPSNEHPTGGAICAKGRAAPEHIQSPLRLTHPLVRTNPRGAVDPGWVKISWDEALAEIASKLEHARTTSGAESVAFAMTTPSGTPIVDSYEWVERFIRCYGSPNLIYAIEVCGWHKDYAHALTFGRGIGIPDTEHADTFILWGHNPARTWLAQATRYAAARRRGATLVVVDPQRGGSGQDADLWMPVRPGSDGALALGAIRHLLSTETFDQAFTSRWTNAPFLVDLATGRLIRASELWASGSSDSYVVRQRDGRLAAARTPAMMPNDCDLYAQGTVRDLLGKLRPYASVLHRLRDAVEPYTVAHVARTTWIDESEIVRFNSLFENAPRLSYHAWTGLGQHSNATQTERCIGILYALTGACDRQGGNLWTVAPPVRPVNSYTELLSATQRAKALGLQDLPLGPPRFGFITAQDFAKAVLERQPYPVTMLMSFGSNMPVSQANSSRNMAALQALEFHAHVDMYMSPMAENADIVLPANMPWEREALRCGFEISQEAAEHIQLRPRMVEPLKGTRADYDIVFDLARRLGMHEEFFDGDIEAGWNHQLAPLGITVEDLRRHPAGLRFPQPFRYKKYERVNHDGHAQGFATPSGVVELYSEQLADIGQSPLPIHVIPASLAATSASDSDFPLTLSTAKNGWFVHSSHRHIASLRKRAPNPTVQISPHLAKHHDVADGDWAYVITQHGRATLQVCIDPQLHDAVVIADFGWWQACEPLGRDASDVGHQYPININAILSDQFRDPVSGSVPLRAVACRLEPVHDLNRRRWHGERVFHVAACNLTAEDIVALTLTPVDGQVLPDFMPGQHVLVATMHDQCSRPYSLTSMHKGASHLSIGVRLEGDGSAYPGKMSSRLHRLQVGDLLKLSMPMGNFTLPVIGSRPIVLMANGIGITPFMGYLEALLHTPAEQRPPRVLLFYVCRDGRTHAYQKRLRELADAIPSVQIVTVYRRPRPEDRPGIDYDLAATLDFGLIQDSLITDRALAYLCGSPSFIDAARAGLTARGIPQFDILAEAFCNEVDVPADLTAQTIVVEGEDQSFEWQPNDGAILSAAERARVDLPSGCRVGQCESCLMEVVSGQISHLSPYEGPTGYCLTCQAVPLTTVTLRR